MLNIPLIPKHVYEYAFVLSYYTNEQNKHWQTFTYVHTATHIFRCAHTYECASTHVHLYAHAPTHRHVREMDSIFIYSMFCFDFNSWLFILLKNK